MHESTLDIKTLGALIAVIIALVEVVKIGGKLLLAKWGYGPKQSVQKAVGESSKLTQSIANRIDKIAEQTKELHDWHRPEVSPGVKVWWNRPDMEKEVSNLSEHIAVLDESVSDLAAAVKPLVKDMQVVKEEVHDMALREKYRRGGTGATFPAVGTKKRE